MAVSSTVGVGIGPRNGFMFNYRWGKSRCSSLIVTRSYGVRKDTFFDDPSRGVGVGASARDYGKLIQEKEDLKVKLDKKTKEVRELEKNLAAAQSDNGRLELQLGAFKKPLEKQINELKSRLESSKKSGKDADESHKKVVSFLKAEHKREVEAKRVEHEKAMETLRQSAAPGLTLLAAERQRGVEDTKRELEVEHERALQELEENLQSRFEEQLKQEKEHGVNVKALRAEKVKLETENSTLRRDQIASMKRAKAALTKRDELQKELNGRRARASTDRPNYHTYREIYTELKSAGYDLLRPLGAACVKLLAESKLWRESAERFKRSPLVLLRSGNGPHVKRNEILMRDIIAFLDYRAEHTHATYLETEAMTAEYVSTLSSFSEVAHDHRLVANFLHFSDNQSDVETVTLVHFLSSIRPLQDRREELKAEVDRARAQGMTDELSRAHAKLGITVLLVSYFRACRATERRKALLNSQPIDKIISHRTDAFRQRLQACGAILESFADGKTDRDRPKLLQLRRDHAKLRQQYLDFVNTVSRRAQIEEDLGLTNPSELLVFDANQLKMIEASRREERELLTQLGVGVPRPRTQRERVVEKARRAPVAMATGISGKKELALRNRVIRLESPESREDLLRVTEENLERDTSILAARIERGHQEASLAQSQLNVANLQKKVTIIRDTIIDLNKNLSQQRYEEQQDTGSAAKSSSSPSKRQTRSLQRVSPGIGSLSKVRRGSRSRMARFTTSRPYSTRAYNTGAQDLENTAIQAKASLREAPNMPFTDCEPRSHEAPSMQEWEDEASSEPSDASYATSSSIGSNPSSQDIPIEIDIEEQFVHTFNIPEKDYRDAVMASPSSTAAFWSHSLYKSPQGQGIRIHYCKSLETAETQLQHFLNEPVLGFDLEWEQYARLETSGIKKNVSLIQIAAEDKIMLIHVACFQGDKAERLMPPTLRTILENPNVIKAGVNVNGDAKRMLMFFDIQMKGVFELSHMYRLVKYSTTQPSLMNFKFVSLAEQVHTVLLLPLLKSEVRTSAWSRALTPQQANYAAADAYAGYRLFHKLDNERKSMRPKPPRPPFLEAGAPIVLGDGSIVEKSKDRRRVKDSAAGGAAVVEDEDEFDEGTEFNEALEKFADTYEHPGASTEDGPPSEGSDDEPAAALYPDLSKAMADMEISSPPTADPWSSTTTQSTQLALADRWISTYTKCSPKTGPATLRAYHLWHHQTLTLQEVAQICRDPPLAITTVASYVMQAIKEEPGLEFDRKRAREALEVLPRGVWPAYGMVTGES